MMLDTIFVFISATEIIYVTMLFTFFGDDDDWLFPKALSIMCGTVFALIYNLIKTHYKELIKMEVMLPVLGIVLFFGTNYLIFKLVKKLRDGE